MAVFQVYLYLGETIVFKNNIKYYFPHHSLKMCFDAFLGILNKVLWAIEKHEWSVDHFIKTKLIYLKSMNTQEKAKRKIKEEEDCQRELLKEIYEYQRVVNIFLNIETMLRTKWCEPEKSTDKAC